MTSTTKLTKAQARVLICSTAPEYGLDDMLELTKDYDRSMYEDAFEPDYSSLILECADGEIEFLYDRGNWTGWLWDDLTLYSLVKKGKRLI